MNKNPITKVALFENQKIRKIWHENKWWFSIIDIVGALTESANPRDYWYKMKIRVKTEDGCELSTICRQLKLPSADGKEYEILTAEISKAAFDMTPSEYKKYKGLKRENLRDHMNDLELIFSMLGEAATTEITNVEHPLGFDANKKVSRRGGNVAKEARVKLENETGKKIVRKENYLQNRITQQKTGKHS